MNSHDEYRQCSRVAVAGVKAPRTLKDSKRALDRFFSSSTVLRQRRRAPSRQKRHACSVAEMKTQQSSKIREIGEALVAAGYVALDEQAAVLGLCRSTTWTILNATHKNSGLSAATINRILAAPQLPTIVRAKIHEYIEEKTNGLYGDSKTRLRKFAATLNPATSTKHRQ
jgi:hypothetical protein